MFLNQGLTWRKLGHGGPRGVGDPESLKGKRLWRNQHKVPETNQPPLKDGLPSVGVWE